MNSSNETLPTVRGLQAMLRRMKFLVPDIRSVSGPGIDVVVLQEALAREELVLAVGEADAEIYWQPGERFSGSSRVRVAVVVAVGVESLPLPHLAQERVAQTYVPLRDWVAGWFRAGGLAEKILAPILVSPAVGDRPTRVSLPGNREWISTREPVVSCGHESGAFWKMAMVTGGGCGFFPLMPATLACLVMIPPALICLFLGGWTALFAASLVTFVGSTVASVALEKWAGRQLLAEDPREFVLDEFAGMALTWMFLPPGAPWWVVIVGFFLFRIFDIFKWGVDWVEHLPIPGKIVWDDLLAGLYAGIVLWGICFFL